MASRAREQRPLLHDSRLSPVSLPSHTFTSLNGTNTSCWLFMSGRWQDDKHARDLLQWFDPALNKPADEKSYGQNCELTITNLYNGFDLFAFAHFVGWFGKAVILRDFWACTILSVMFEVWRSTQ